MTRDVRTGFSDSAKGFGRCLTDRQDTNKDPQVMRETVPGGGKRIDHFTNPATRPYTRAFFNMYGKPMPPDELIHRGNSQDLTFRPQEGLVIRTGPMNIADMIHPGVLQPLYWMPFQNTDHVVAVYAGIQLPDAIFDPAKQKEFEGDRDRFLTFMKDTGQNAKDSKVPHNYGYIKGNIVMLDTEDFSCGSRHKATKTEKEEALQAGLQAGIAPHDVIRSIMVQKYGDHPEFEVRIKAFDYHQPLRAALYEAMITEDPEEKAFRLSNFNATCEKAIIDGEKGHSAVALYADWTKSPAPAISS